MDSKKNIDVFDEEIANAAVGEMEKQAGHIMKVVEVIKMVAKSKGVESGLRSTCESLEKHIEKNKGYLEEAKDRAKEAELKAISTEEKSDARIATILDNEAGKISEIKKRIKAKEEEGEARANSIEAETASRINTAKVAAKNAEREAMDAERKKGEALEAFRLVKDKYLSVLSEED